jgi:DNA adenine methylase
MFIPYIGEKTKFTQFITPNIPSDISTYVEPFGGMMGVFFSLDYDKYTYVDFIYNDINNLNYNLFNQLQSNKDFIDLVKSTKVNEEFYKFSLKGIITTKDDTLLALQWLVILTCSNPYKIGQDCWKGDREFEIFKMKYSTYKSSIDRITSIYNTDYKDIINKYDSPETFFYVDPPYKGKEKYYINHNFGTNSHLELSEILNNIQGRFLLSYYDFYGLRELYPNCRFESKKTIMGTEWIIMNY